MSGPRLRGLEDKIERAMTDGIGELGGGEIGTATMTVSTYVRSDGWNAALAAVRQVLTDMGLANVALIARHDTRDDANPVAVWPAGSERGFTC
jgi:hypothetical protein